MYKIVKFALLLILSVIYLVSGADARSLRDCIRISFPGQDLGTLTNICNKNLYAYWVDDRGDHVTALGKNASLSIGKIHGRIQITDADLQNSGGSGSEAKSTLSQRRGSASKESCDTSKVVCDYICKTQVEAGNKQAACYSSCSSNTNNCIRTGNDFSGTVGKLAASRVSSSPRPRNYRAVVSRRLTPQPRQQACGCTNVAYPICCSGGVGYSCIRSYPDGNTPVYTRQLADRSYSCH